MDTVHRLLLSIAIVLPLLLGGATTLKAEEIRPDVPVVTAGFRFGVGGGHHGRSYRHGGYRNWDNQNYYYYPKRGYYYNYYPYNYNYGNYNSYYPYYYNNGYYNEYNHNSYPSNRHYYQYSW